MGKVVVIRQNTEQANIMGMEKIGISMFPNTNVGFSIPYINGEFRHNLTSKELKVVEEHYGVKFNKKTIIDRMKKTGFAGSIIDNYQEKFPVLKTKFKILP